MEKFKFIIFILFFYCYHYFSRKLKLINIFLCYYSFFYFFYQYALIKILPGQNRVLTVAPLYLSFTR